MRLVCPKVKLPVVGHLLWIENGFPVMQLSAIFLFLSNLIVEPFKELDF